MAAYLIVNVDVKDPARYQEYVRAVPATLVPFGGRFLVRGGRAVTLEGTFEPKRMVVIQFDSVELARAWWESAAYAAPRAIRQATATTDLILVEGL